MRILVNRTDNVEVRVFCWEKNNAIEASHQKSEVPQDVSVVEQIDFTFRRPNYSDSNNIIRNSDIKTDGEGLNLNITSFQEQILTRLLIDWSVKDEQDKKIPVTLGNINSLEPAVARAAVAGALEKIKI